MSASLAGAIKAHVESQGFGVAVFRDGAPADKLPPYVVIQEGIGIAPEAHGDFGSANAHQGDTEQVQVDLYQYARSAPAAGTPGRLQNAEDYDLPGKLRRALTGLPSVRSYGTPARRIYGLRVIAGQRFPISDNIVRHNLTVNVRRDA